MSKRGGRGLFSCAPLAASVCLLLPARTPAIPSPTQCAAEAGGDVWVGGGWWEKLPPPPQASLGATITANPETPFSTWGSWPAGSHSSIIQARFPASHFLKSCVSAQAWQVCSLPETAPVPQHGKKNADSERIGVRRRSSLGSGRELVGRKPWEGARWQERRCEQARLHRSAPSYLPRKEAPVR